MDTKDNDRHPADILASLEPGEKDYAAALHGVLDKIPQGFLQRFLFGENDSRGQIVVFTNPMVTHRTRKLTFYNENRAERETLEEIYNKDRFLWKRLVEAFAHEWKDYERYRVTLSQKQERLSRIKEELDRAAERREPKDL